MSAILKEFESYLLVEKRASKNTYLSYLRDVAAFEQFLLEVRSVTLARADVDDVNAYFTKLDADGKANATSMRTAAALKCFYNHLVLLGTIESSPVRVERKKKKELKFPEILTSSEVNLLLAQPKTVDVKGYRDRAMLELLYATGMRVTELVSLNVEDVNLDLKFVRCNSEGRERMIPLYPSAVDALSNYINRARRAMLASPDESSLFVNVNGERMTRQGFWKLIKHYTELAGIQKDITPHTLRHSFAVHLLENGADLRSLQELMGHADASSTQLYANLIKGRLKDVYAKSHPRGKNN
ncbi:MAG: tyrosine recombinase [Clostridiaceae bacterium]|nr:tyrosine recombinase [Clostridiaceae bacterium]